jgi:hypothetical protein
LFDKVINFEAAVFIAHCCLISVGSVFWVWVFWIQNISPNVWNMFFRKGQQLCYHLPTHHHGLFQGMLPGMLRMDYHCPSNFRCVGNFFIYNYFVS